jgi:hypothetical protein
MMKKLLKALLILKYKIIYPITTWHTKMMVFFYALAGQNYYDTLKARRYKKAVRKADRLHIQNNGRRYFVIPGNNNDYYVMDRDTIKANIRHGVFRKDAQITDFLRECPYYTKSECLSTTKGLKVLQKERGWMFYFWIWFGVAVVVMTVTVYLLKYYRQ